MASENQTTIHLYLPRIIFNIALAARRFVSADIAHEYAMFVVRICHWVCGIEIEIRTVVASVMIVFWFAPLTVLMSPLAVAILFCRGTMNHD